MFVSGKDIRPHEAMMVFDIETVPKKNLSSIQQKELKERFEKSKLYQNVYSRTVNDNLTDINVDPPLIAAAKRKFMATSPYFGKIVCIGIYWPTSQTKEALIGNEQNLLTKFWERIDPGNFSGSFISFNGLSFDVPFIIRRSMVHGILPTNEQFLDTYKYQKKPHRDVYLMLTDYSRDFFINLDLACETYNIPSPKHGKVRADNVAEYYERGEIELIADYCLKDVIATYKLYEKAKLYLKY